MTSQEHRAIAQQKFQSVPCAVITVSDTRTQATDGSGQLIQKLLSDHAHQTLAYHLVKDEPDQLGALIDELSTHETLRMLLINGGTGISTRDRSFEVVSTRLEKTLTGFGEIFRMLSFQEIGAAAMLSRATAGLYRGKVLVLMPGSTHAVNLAMTKLILPEIEHLAWEITR